MIICKHCGKPQPEDATFCPFCGKPVEPDLTVAAQVEPPACQVETPAYQMEPPPYKAEPPAYPLEPPAYIAGPPVYQQGFAPPARRKNKKLLVGLIAGGALLLIGLLCVLLLGGSGGAGADAASGFAAPEKGSNEQSDIDLPIPGAGEVLYVGVGAMPQADKFTVAFILSADGTEVHDVNIYADNLTLTFGQDGISVEISATAHSAFSGVYPVNSSGDTTLDLGGSTITELTFGDGTAVCQVDYVYHHSAPGSASQDIPVGKCAVTLTAQGDAPETGTQPNASVPSKPTPTLVASGVLTIEGNAYDVSIADVFLDEEKNETTVHFSIPALDGSIVIRDGRMIIMAQASIEVNGEILHFGAVSNTDALIQFSFPTNTLPDKIYVYAHTGGHDQPGTLVFDGEGNVIDLVK